MLYSGATAGVPYSLSRWTDVAVSKWRWFEDCLKAGKMVAFDPRTATPGVWSLAPEDTLGLVFWTKNPENMINHRRVLSPYEVIVHMTATGWEEVEKGAPTLEESTVRMMVAAKAFKTYWRFSPVPLLPQNELFTRFCKICECAMVAGMDRVFVSFLQENDRMPETRSVQERFDILNIMSEKAASFNVDVILCADDQSFAEWSGALFKTDACVQPTDFGKGVQSENCGCVLMVDPFTINEACQYDCKYCYAGDQSLSPERRDTTSEYTRVAKRA
jgi:hypothetical protein